MILIRFAKLNTNASRVRKTFSCLDKLNNVYIKNIGI